MNNHPLILIGTTTIYVGLLISGILVYRLRIYGVLYSLKRVGRFWLAISPYLALGWCLLFIHLGVYTRYPTLWGVWGIPLALAIVSLSWTTITRLQAYIQQVPATPIPITDIPCISINSNMDNDPAGS